MIHTGLQMVTGGRGLRNRYRNRPGHARMRQLKEYYDGNVAVARASLHYDRKLTFDKLTDVYNSGTTHDEDQPCHCIVLQPDICHPRCTNEYGNPCQYFCPAAVYEMVDDGNGLRLQINSSNCVHCKTCDIMDPYEIINWVTPEGGDGPGYELL